MNFKPSIQDHEHEPCKSHFIAVQKKLPSEVKVTNAD